MKMIDTRRVLPNIIKNMFLKKLSALIILGGALVFLQIWCSATASERMHNISLTADKGRGEVRITGHVQKTDSPRMTDWGQKNQALLGTRNGDYNDHFVFLIDAQVQDIYKALLEIGADPDFNPEMEMPGSPVEIIIQWIEKGQSNQMLYQNFFLQKAPNGSEKESISWEPDLVFHGLGAKKGVNTGCLACPVYCPGGIIGDQIKPANIPILRADWETLPEPGTEITAVIRVVGR